MLNITPPVSMKFETLKEFELCKVRVGICPHCVTVTLEPKHSSDGLRFLQCSTCTVVVVVDV
jgi:formate dehydrogenase maturation protein FdhE